MSGRVVLEPHSTTTAAGSEPNTFPQGPTQELCDWISRVSLQDVPKEVVERAKFLMLDGIACGLTSAHMPASETASRAFATMEPGNTGTCSVIGHPELKLTPMSAATLNGSFIQGFELDTWHRDAPIHSTSVILPAIFAAAEHHASRKSSAVNGTQILLSAIVGLETGPRVGLALHGRHVLSEGWHSGAVFGGSASAAAVSKVLELNPAQVEDALGSACTQSCGLMSAQFESDVKRMQHGFAARNGVLGAFLAAEGYSGIKKVYEREYGGFLAQFSKGNAREPSYLVDEISKDLGLKWQLMAESVKPYAARGSTHSTIDCVRALQEDEPRLYADDVLKKIKSIKISLDEPFFKLSGWQPIRPSTRPSITATGAQLNIPFICATELVDGDVLATQFKPSALEDDRKWSLIEKTTCELHQEYPPGAVEIAITILKDNGEDMTIKKFWEKQRGVNPPLTNDEVREKYRTLTKSCLGSDEERIEMIEKCVLGIEDLEDIGELLQLLSPLTEDPLA